MKILKQKMNELKTQVFESYIAELLFKFALQLKFAVFVCLATSFLCQQK